MSFSFQVSLRGLKGRSNLLFFIIFWAILIMPAMAQTPPLTSQEIAQQQSLLHSELRTAIKSGNKQQADQYRAQLISLQKQQFDQTRQLFSQMRDAIKSGDKVKAQQIREQIMAAQMPQNQGPRKAQDPQETFLINQLKAANKNGNKQQADQIRTQLNTLHKLHFAQIKQLQNQIRDAIKSGNKQQAQLLSEQLMSMMP